MQIFVVGALALSIAACAQNAEHEPEPSATQSATLASADAVTYREQLRKTADSPIAQGTDHRLQPNSGDCDAERLAYRERLRHLANGENVGRLASISAQGADKCEASAAKSQADAAAKARTDSQAPQAKVEVPPAESADTLKTVSVRKAPSTRTDADSPAATTAGTGEPKAPADKAAEAAYADTLRRVSTGEVPPAEHSLNLIAPREKTTERNFVKNLAFDQLHIWESPFKLRDSDAAWAVPFGITTGVLIATDHDTSKQLAKPSRLNISKQISDAGLYATIGAGAGFYGLGLMTHDEHKRETGLLAGEAFVNAALVAEALKYAVGRQRPFEADHFGHIGKGGSSFPSGHAIDTWAAATVIAHEYPNPLVEIGAYGLAATVAATRVTAGQHFPSDVLVGGTLGYLIGRKIYNDHHNPDLDGGEFGTFVHEHETPKNKLGSPYVPLDSWAYAAIERLIGWGYIRSAFLDMRPWTRMEFSRLLQEARESLDDRSGDPLSTQAERIYSQLASEFRAEGELPDGSPLRNLALESVYTRLSGISGTPLNDSFHFGQTIVDDYGRPYAQGLNAVTGFSAHAEDGPLAVYVRGEYQHAPSAPGYSQSVQQVIAAQDSGAVLPSNPFPSVDRVKLLDAYGALNLGGYQLSFGKQSLWWGPSEGGGILFSDNAEPIAMVRISNPMPIQLPGFLSILGPIRIDAFFGQLAGQHFVRVGDQFLQLVGGPNFGPLSRQPFLNGQKLTLKPTANFEFSVSRTAIIGGPGAPLTLGSFGRSFFTLTSGSGTNVGDRRSSADLSYKIPKLRDWLLFYADAFTDDDVSPLNYPRKSAMSAGLYLSHLPRIPKLDFRAEGVYTDIPNQQLSGFFYWNRHYINGYTNNGNILGNWVGRDGHGVQAWSTYWFNARTNVQLSYRNQHVNPGFVPGGGTLNDFSIGAVDRVREGLDLSATVQYEKWNYPVLSLTRQSNVTSSVQITYWPKWRIR